MTIILMKWNPARISSFLEQDDHWWLVGGVCLHTGLFSAYMPLFVLGVYLLPQNVKSITRASLMLSLSVFVYVLLGGLSFYQTISLIFETPCYHCFVMSFVWLLIWVPWTFFYVLSRKYEKHFILSSGLMLLLGPWNESFCVGFSHLEPLLMYSPWERMLPWLGNIWVFLFVLSVHWLYRPVLSHLIWVLPLLMNSAVTPQEKLTMPSWLDQITILPEGIERTDEIGNVVECLRIWEKNRVFYASVGTGDVHGMSLKRHLVPIVESRYSPYYYSRLLTFHRHHFLVLVCNDALFLDVEREMNKAEAVVVVSYLQGVSRTPLQNYYFKRLRYLSYRYKKPVRLVDTTGITDFL